MVMGGFFPTRGRVDAPYTWLVIAADREVAAWAARRGSCDRVSPLVAGDPLAGEFHASLGAVTSSAFSIEALYLETIQRLRQVPGRGSRWEPPAVEEMESRRGGGGRVAGWERAILTSYVPHVR